MAGGRSIAVYGGSFNPPHMGHQTACLYLLEAFGFQEVWLVPAGLHPFGKQLAPFADRAAMCRRLAAPFGDRVRVETREGQPDSTGRTHDTLVALVRDHPTVRFTLVIGADIVTETDSWHRWGDIVALVPILILGRGGYGNPGEAQGEHHAVLPPVSSTQVRERLAKGETTRGLLPREVARYIQDQGLYGSETVS